MKSSFSLPFVDNASHNFFSLSVRSTELQDSSVSNLFSSDAGNKRTHFFKDIILCQKQQEITMSPWDEKVLSNFLQQKVAVSDKFANYSPNVFCLL